MARFLAIDNSTNALDLCMRAQAAGHTVKWYVRSKGGERKTAGDGILEKIEDFAEIKRKWLDWADLIWLPDNMDYTAFLEPYRIGGYPIFGAGLDAAELEHDRQAGQDAMRKAGMKVIEGEEFHDYDAAIAHVEKTGKTYVCKPSGPASEAQKALTYVAKDPADLVFMLERWKKHPDLNDRCRKYGFILQEKVTGTEMAVGGWFGPGGWSKWFLENFEHKKLMDGDVGPNTGEMGTLARYAKRSKLAEAILLPLTPLLKRLKYVGYIDNNAIIEDSGAPRPLELTTRDGWPTRYNVTALHRGMDPIQWMLDLVHGKDTIDVKEGEVSISVLVALPPFPYAHATGKDVDGIPLYDATDFEHVHLSEARLDEDVPCMLNGKLVRMPCYVSTEDYPLVVTGTGETITGARRSAYAALRKIRIPDDPMYRLDIGYPRRLREGLPKIQKHGYATRLLV